MYDKQTQNLFKEVADIRKRLNTLAPDLAKLEAPKYNDKPLQDRIDALKDYIEKELSKPKEDTAPNKELLDLLKEEVFALNKKIDDKTEIKSTNSKLVGWSNGQPAPVEFKDLFPPMKKGETIAWNGSDFASMPLEVKPEPDIKTFHRFDFKDINDTDIDWVIADIEDAKTWVENIFVYYPQDFASSTTDVISAIIAFGEESATLTPLHSLQKIVVDKPTPFKITVSLGENTSLTAGLLEVWIEKKKFTI